jgi:hypothetical protein
MIAASRREPESKAAEVDPPTGRTTKYRLRNQVAKWNRRLK